MVQQETVMHGTVVNGAIVLDGNPVLPDGARVQVRVSLDPAVADELDDFGPIPPDTETYEEHIAALKRSFAEKEAGVPGIPLDEAMARISAEFKLPPVRKA